MERSPGGTSNNLIPFSPVDILALFGIFAAAMAIPISVKVIGDSYRASLETLLEHLKDAERTGEPLPLVEKRLELEREKLSILKLQNESRRVRTRVEDVSS